MLHYIEAAGADRRPAAASSFHPSRAAALEKAQHALNRQQRRETDLKRLCSTATPHRPVASFSKRRRLYPHSGSYSFFHKKNPDRSFSSGFCRGFMFSHSYLCRRRHKVAMIAEPNWTFASRFLRRKAPAEWRIYEKKQPHREGFVPDTAVLISVYYVRSDSAAPAQIMATPAFDCGACSDT